MYAMRWRVGWVLLAVASLLSACTGLPLQQNTAAASAVQGKFAPATAVAIAAAHAQGVELRLTPLPASAWAVLEASPAIPVGVAPGQPANVYVIFDAQCPFCADLYWRLQDDVFRGIGVRWAPVAFMKQDSAAIANVLLAANDPSKALDDYFRANDLNSDKGYELPSFVMQARHAQDYNELMRHLSEWGGYTPMIIIRTPAGEVLQVHHDKGEALRRALDLANGGDVRAPKTSDANVPWWTFVDAQAGRMLQGIEEMKRARNMRRDMAHGTQYRENWVGGPVSLQGGVVVSKSTLAIAKKAQPPTWIVLGLDFEGHCIGFEQLKQHYPEIANPTPSSPHASERTTTWAVAQSQLMLYFEMRLFEDRQCLQRVALGQNKV